MNKKILLAVIIGIVIIAGGVIFAFVEKNNNANNCKANGGHSCAVKNDEIILFYGEGCPHCVIVDKYIKDNNIEATVQFVKKEVFNSTSSAELLVQRAKACGLQTDSIGVPFLWVGLEGKYYIGEQEIICFFKGKIGQ